MPRLAVIDFEASCLPRHGRSYPIEVAVSEVGGPTSSWLIRPHPTWLGWQWTEEAQRLHGVTRVQLEREGLPVGEVAQRLHAMMQGRRVFADSNLDAYWHETLGQAAGAFSPIAIEPVGVLLEELGVTGSNVVQAESEAARRIPERHRAAPDAQRLATMIEILRTEALQRSSMFPWTKGPQAADSESHGLQLIHAISERAGSA